MMIVLLAFISGSVMAFGLAYAGMVNPSKVIGFLDVGGAFDPTLIFVMTGALAIAFLGMRMANRRSKPLLAACFDSPSQKNIDARLCIGAAIFGAGWGLAGVCPGPAIVAMGMGVKEAFFFSVAMVVGMLAAQQIVRQK